jgi:hypothetical protein
MPSTSARSSSFQLVIIAAKKTALEKSKSQFVST